MANKIENLSEFCALSNIEEKHLCKDIKIKFNCEHYACVSCFMYWLERVEIKCNICDQIQTNIDSIIDNNKMILLEFTNEAYENKLSTLNKVSEKMNKKALNIESHVEYMREEVDIKTESLKCELASIKNLFNEELDEIESKWKKDEIDELFEEGYSNELNQLELLIKKDLNEESIEKYKNKIKELEKMFNEYKSKIGEEPQFLEEYITFNKNDIGKFVKKHKMDEEIMGKIEKNEYETQEHNFICSDLFIMPDGKILFIDADDSRLVLYDENMNVLKIKKDFKNNKKSYKFRHCTYDGNKTMFFTGDRDILIMKTDLELNELDTLVKYEYDYDVFDYSDEGVNSGPLYFPHGICYFNDHIFVCDKVKHCLVKYDTNFIFKEWVSFRFVSSYFSYPQIKNIKNIAMVTLYEIHRSLTCFYDLNNFNLLRIYDHDCEYSSIGASINTFYRYDYQKNTMSCYDSNGELYNEVALSLLTGPMEPYMSSIACRNKLMIFGIEKTLVKIKW